jgi:hypothetical protein
MLTTPELFSFQNALLILAYAFLGGGIKYIDQVFDEQRFSKSTAAILALLCGLIMGYLIAVDPQSATILVALVAGCLLAGKVDNDGFKIGIFTVFSTIAVITLVSLNFSISVVPLIFLTISCWADEWGHDQVSRRSRVNSVVKKFFYYRFTMKIVMLALVAMGVFQPIYLAAFLAFDLAYGLMNAYSRLKLPRHNGAIPTRQIYIPKKGSQ